jgi:hypothetical protein
MPRNYVRSTASIERERERLRRDDEIKSLALDGISITEIARRFMLSKQRISQITLREGVRVKDQQRADVLERANVAQAEREHRLARRRAFVAKLRILVEGNGLSMNAAATILDVVPQYIISVCKRENIISRYKSGNPNFRSRQQK